MKEFQLAAERDQKIQDEGEILEFTLGDEVFQSKYPTPSQSSLVIGAFGLSEAEAVQSVYRFLKRVLLGDGFRRLKRMVDEEVIDFGMLFGGNAENESGIVDWIIEEAASRPTQPSTASSSSQPSGGRRSTGRSPGLGSTLSD